LASPRWLHKILCLHGGLSPEIKRLKDIHDLPREDNVDLQEVFADLLWSSPNVNPKKQEWDFSPEGIGFAFPLVATKSFLKNNNINLLVRGHSFLENGIQEFHEGKILSVFSTTDHCLRNNKTGGIVEVDHLGQVHK
jgi:diadenosine tetraphosphatase ApaH/serine/threonine PP2A family protein phosphatase